MIQKLRSGGKMKYIEALAAALCLLAHLLFQLPMLDNDPWEGYDPWRQSDTYSIAVNYAQYDMNPMHPQFNYDGTGDIYVQLELQIVPYISALIFRLTGAMTPAVPRALGIALFLASAVFVYLISRRFAGIFGSLCGLIIYLFMPISLLYSRAVMPEACALFFLMGGVYFLLRWYEDDAGWAVWLSAVLTAFAIIEKIPTAFVGLLILAAFLWKKGRGTLKCPELYGYGAIALGLPGLYYFCASRIATMRYVDGIAVKHIFSSKIFSVFTSEGITFFRENLPLFFGWALLIAAFAGLLLCLNRERRFLAVLTAAFALEFAVIVAIIRFGYYMVFMAPVLAMLCAVLMQELLNWKKPIAALACVLVIGLTARGGMSLCRDWSRVNEGIASVGELISSMTEPDEPVAVSTDQTAYLNAANRHGYRANIQYHDFIPVGAEAETEYYMDHGVRYFVVLTGGVYNDENGEYLRYLRENFPVAAENEYCTVYEMEK